MATIFQFRQNIHVLEDPAAYRREVVNYLNLVNTTYSGQTLLRYIFARAARKLLIVPYVPSQETKFGAVNAYASADSLADAYPKYYPIMGTLSIPGYGDIQVPMPFLGTGAGSPVTLKYHPAMWRQLMANRGGRVYPGDGPGEVLFHEMVHAMRMLSGQMIDSSVTEDADMDDFEEFCAIVAANIYRSERGFKDMRKNHHGSEALSKELTNPDAYAVAFEDEIQKWYGQQPHFVMDLARSQAAFNPLRSFAIQQGLMPTPMAV